MNRLAAALLFAPFLACSPSTPEAPEEEVALPAVSVPEALRESRVTHWKQPTEVWVVFEKPELGRVTDIALPEPHGAGRLHLVGTLGAWLPAAGDAPEAFVPFAPVPGGGSRWDVAALDLEGDGRLEYLSRGGNWHPVGLLAGDGGILWRAATGWGANRLAAGDVDGDGATDFVLAMNGGGGLHRLDAKGEKLWSVDGANLWDAAIVGPTAGAPGPIVHTNAGGELVWRSASGERIAAARPSPYVTQFSVVRWPEADSPPRIAYFGEGSLFVVDAAGARVLSVDLGLPARNAELATATFRPEPDGPLWLASLADYPVFGRSALSLVDKTGDLVYQRILPRTCTTLEPARVPPEGDALLVGCEGRLMAAGPEVATHALSLELRAAHFGTDSEHLLEDLRALAWSLNEVDRGGEGIPHARRALALAEACCPDEVGPSLNVLGLVQIGAGRTDAAEATLRRALPLLEDDEEATSSVLYNLGRIALERNEWQKAAGLYERSLELVPAEPDGSSSDAARAAYNLSYVYLELGRTTEALAQIRLAIQNDERAYGPDHPEVAKDREQLAKVLAAMKLEGRTASAQ